MLRGRGAAWPGARPSDLSAAANRAAGLTCSPPGRESMSGPASHWGKGARERQRHDFTYGTVLAATVMTHATVWRRLGFPIRIALKLSWSEK